MAELCPQFSGSTGNSYYIGSKSSGILVDIGRSCKQVSTVMQRCGIDPLSVQGILITHEHSDHISGLTTLTKQLRLPVYASPGTGRQLCYRIAFLEELLRPVAPGEGFSVGGLAIESFPTSHDAAESVGYALSAGGRKAAVVTDLGYVTGAVLRGIRGADLLVAEANHDVEWVQSGPYPYHLKARILGDRGHLSNEAGAELAALAAESGTRAVVLAHLSRENNTPARAWETAARRLRSMGCEPNLDLSLTVAPRSGLGPTYHLESGRVLQASPSGEEAALC